MPEDADEGGSAPPASHVTHAKHAMHDSPHRRLMAEKAVLAQRARFVRVDYPGGVEALPAELRLLAQEGYAAPGDSGSPADAPPPWMDKAMFVEGQRVARDNHAGLAHAELLSLFLLFAFPSGLDPLISTARSDTPDAAGRRYLSTSLRVLAWFSSDPFDGQSDCWRHLAAVRRMHSHVRAACNNGTPEELAVKFTVGRDQPRPLLCPKVDLFGHAFSSMSPGAYLGPCPALAANGCPDAQRAVQDAANGIQNAAIGVQNAALPSLASVSVEVDRLRRPFLSQAEMAITQWGFFGLFISKPGVFAAPYISRGELEALVHMWAVLGYCLGIEDRFNWGLGGLDLVLRRSEVYLRLMAVPNLRVLGCDPSRLAHWEHMGRCMMDGMRQYLPMPSFEASVAYLADDVLELGAPRALLRKGLGWRYTLQLWHMKLFLRVVPRWLPAWARWLAGGLRRALLAKADALKPIAAAEG